MSKTQTIHAIRSTVATAFARSFVGAGAKHDAAVAKAGESYLTNALAAVETLNKAINVPLTAAMFNESLKPALVKAMAAKGLEEATISSQVSRVRNVCVGVSTKGLKPNKGETFKTFAARCGEALREGTGEAKRGPKARVAPKVAGAPTASPLAPQGKGKLDHAKVAEGDYLRACALVAGFAASKPATSRAQRLAAIFRSQDLGEQFDTFAATVLTSPPKK